MRHVGLTDLHGQSTEGDEQVRVVRVLLQGVDEVPCRLVVASLRPVHLRQAHVGVAVGRVQGEGLLECLLRHLEIARTVVGHPQLVVQFRILGFHFQRVEQLITGRPVISLRHGHRSQCHAGGDAVRAHDDRLFQELTGGGKIPSSNGIIRLLKLIPHQQVGKGTRSLPVAGACSCQRQPFATHGLTPPHLSDTVQQVCQPAAGGEIPGLKFEGGLKGCDSRAERSQRLQSRTATDVTRLQVWTCGNRHLEEGPRSLGGPIAQSQFSEASCAFPTEQRPQGFQAPAPIVGVFGYRSLPFDAEGGVVRGEEIASLAA